MDDTGRNSKTYKMFLVSNNVSRTYYADTEYI